MSVESANIFKLPATFTVNVQDHNWNSVASSVKYATKTLSSDDGRNISPDILDEIAHALQEATLMLHDQESPDVITSLTECYRFLRNACAIHHHLQGSLVKTTIFNSTSDILSTLLRVSAIDTYLPCIKAIVQFLGNAIVGNLRNQLTVWKMLSSHITKLLSNADDSLINFSCMVLYNILIGESGAALVFVTDNAGLLLQCYSSGSEFAVFVIEYVLSKENMLEEIYPFLETEHRLLILDAIWSLLVERESESDEKVKFPLPNLLFLVAQLKQRADGVLTIVKEGMTAEPRETLRLLDVVACASSRSQYLSCLQSDQSLLISIASLLNNVNAIGKMEGGNVFSSVQRLSEMKQSNESVQDHPMFGFKVALVRLIGNLCHQHAGNQDQVRVLDCLPAVLDTCNIDVYNPLLLQWGVLAVRNLLENNPANQQVVAGLVAQGPASNSVLRELGMELHQDGSGSLYIAPLKRS